MTSSPVMNVTSSEAPSTPAAPSDQACYLLNSTSSGSAVTLSYNVFLGATLVFVVVGLVGNALSVLVFSSAPMRSFSSNVYLLTLAVSDSFYLIGYTSKQHVCTALYSELLECGPMPNVMDALPSIGGALCSTPQSLADTHY